MKRIEHLGIAVADSAMWTPNEEYALQGLFGLRIPLLERGIIARNFVMERAGDPAYADQFKTIVLSCEDWDMYDPVMPEKLSAWVRRGGALIVFGRESWVETLASDAGAGRVLVDDASPKTFADPIELETAYKPLLEKAGVVCERRDGFAMRRGDYAIAYALNENFPMVGNFVDVFSPDLEVCKNPEVTSGTCGLFKRFEPAAEPAVIHSTCGLMEQSFEDGVLRFTIRGPQETRFTARISLGGYTCV